MATEYESEMVTLPFADYFPIVYNVILQLKVQAKVLNTALPEVFSSIVTVVINVTDVDDNSPCFVQRSYR